MDWLIAVVVAVLGITILYKLLPHRNMGAKKPAMAFMPKYKTQVTLPASMANSSNPAQELENLLSSYGFMKKIEHGDITKYSRGHNLGDFSVRLAKVNLLISAPKTNCVDLSIEAGWVVAFDTGDFWKFLAELKQKIETAG